LIVYFILEFPISNSQNSTEPVPLAPDHQILVDEHGQYSNIINALGKVGGMLSRELGFKPDGGYHLLWIANQNTNSENGKRYWRMLKNFSDALTIVGWK